MAKTFDEKIREAYLAIEISHLKPLGRAIKEESEARQCLAMDFCKQFGHKFGHDGKAFKISTIKSSTGRWHMHFFAKCTRCGWLEKYSAVMPLGRDARKRFKALGADV